MALNSPEISSLASFHELCLVTTSSVSGSSSLRAQLRTLQETSPEAKGKRNNEATIPPANAGMSLHSARGSSAGNRRIPSSYFFRNFWRFRGSYHDTYITSPSHPLLHPRRFLCLWTSLIANDVCSCAISPRCVFRATILIKSACDFFRWMKWRY